MNNSFYGGRRGAGFEIVKSYPTLQDLKNEFAKNTCPVNYGEYVLTEDSNSIYKRTYDTEGYLYITQIKDVQQIVSSGTEVTVKDVNLQPGYDGTNYNDNISINSEAVADPDTGKVTSQLSFEFPYFVIELEGAQRLDDGTHPFYQKWKIPTSGSSEGSSSNFKDLKVITIQPSDTDIYYTNNTKYSITGKIGKQILVYTFQSSSLTRRYYLGDYNVISSAQFNEADSSIVISFTYDSQLRFSVKFINAVTLIDGKLKITYSTGEFDEFDVKCVSEVTINERKEIVAHYNTGEEVVISDPIKFIDTVSYDKGILTITYSTFEEDGVTPQSQTLSLNYLADIYLNEQLQLVKRYEDGTTALLDETPLKFIEDISIKEDGHLYCKYKGTDTAEDLGVVQITNSLMIEKNMTYEEIYTGPYASLSFSNANTAYILNQLYPNGLNGKLITCGKPEESKVFFAYDATVKEDGSPIGWYYLGSLGAATAAVNLLMVGPDTAENTDKFFNELDMTGVWFVTEEVE